MYEGTKHAFASDAVGRGVDLYRLRDFLGHTDARSTERYAKLADVGKLEVLARRNPDLSLGCRSRDFGDQNVNDDTDLWRGGRDSNPSTIALTARILEDFSLVGGYPPCIHRPGPVESAASQWLGLAARGPASADTEAC